MSIKKSLTNTVIHEYHLGEMVREGALGSVYGAQKEGHSTSLIIKLFPIELQDIQPFHEKITADIEALNQLKHPHILKVIDYGFYEEFFYVVMPFVAGRSLRHFLQENKNGLPLWDVLQIFHQMAMAVSYAHQHNISHYSLRPANILLTRSTSPNIPYKVYVSDFGLVTLAKKMVDQTGSDASNLPAYMSPEQTFELEPDYRADIYSMGVMLYEAVTGFRPFPIRSAFDAARFHSVGQIVSLRAHLPQTPIRLDVLTRRMLAGQVQKRLQSTDEVVSGINRVLRAYEAQQGRPVSSIQARVEELIAEKAKKLDDVEVLDETQPLEVRVLYYGQWNGDTYLLGNKPLKIGRQADADITLVSAERFVSKEHCEILKEDDKIYVRDLNSTNGSLLNEERLQPHEKILWLPNQLLRIGPFSLTWGRKSDFDMEHLSETAGYLAVAHANLTMSLVCENGYPNRVNIGSKPIKLGRAIDCHMTLNHPHISKYHCQIQQTNAGIQITDLGSTNGTVLEGKQLKPHESVTWSASVPLILGPFTILLESDATQSTITQTKQSSS